jgi:hypothetical protein
VSSIVNIFIKLISLNKRDIRNNNIPIIPKNKYITISIVDYKILNIEIKADKEFEYINAAILTESLIQKEAVENTLNLGDYNTKVLAQEITANMAYHLGELLN